VRELEDEIVEAALAMALERKAYGAKMREMKAALADMARLSREWSADANEQDAKIRQRDQEMMAMAKHFESLQVRACGVGAKATATARVVACRSHSDVRTVLVKHGPHVRVRGTGQKRSGKVGFRTCFSSTPPILCCSRAAGSMVGGNSPPPLSSSPNPANAYAQLPPGGEYTRLAECPHTPSRVAPSIGGHHAPPAEHRKAAPLTDCECGGSSLQEDISNTEQALVEKMEEAARVADEERAAREALAKEQKKVDLIMKSFSAETDAASNKWQSRVNLNRVAALGQVRLRSGTLWEPLAPEVRV
jgi:hypothetical protein